MEYDPQRALELLRIGSGYANARFREGQEAAIRHILERRGRLLVVQKTGWGKSFVYFIATRMLREAGHGPALLISPLLALMRNQIAAAGRMGVRAETLNSENSSEWSRIIERIGSGDMDILLFHPKQLASDRFNRQVLALIAPQVSLLVIDEAHCVSDWGHDFVPEYRIIQRMARSLPANVRLLATTATANHRVMEDLELVLGPNLTSMRGDLARSSLTLQTIRLPEQPLRLAWLADQLKRLDGHGIIYTLTVHDAIQVAEWLKSRGLKVEAYTGETGDRREALEQALLDNQVKALVATTALGMGYDKPDLAFVIHYQMPGSVVAYYQQVGRAGRAIDAAYGILLSGDEEDDVINWFIRTAFPSRQEISKILAALEKAPEGLTLQGLLRELNLSQGRLEKAMTLLSLERPPPIVHQDGKWQLTAVTVDDTFWQRIERLTALRRSEQSQMRSYVNLPFGRHMGFLVEALDGDPATVVAPRLPPLPTVAEPASILQAVAFLKRSSLSIMPRQRWPHGGLPFYAVRGSIASNLQAQAGKALCIWGDAGWGKMVRDGKYRDSHFADDLAQACVALIRLWAPQPAPAWVTCVPSLRHPDLVPDFAHRLARALGLPFHAVFLKTVTRAEQKTMENSIQQARNIDGSMELSSPALPPGPVLLFDDVVDSRWTLTVAAWLLRKSGSGEVWPLALAVAGHDS